MLPQPIAFDFKQNLILEDDRVLLQPLVLSDYKYLLPFALNEPELWTYSLANPSSDMGMTGYIQSAIEDREKEKCYTFIIFDKLTQQYAGSTRFYDIKLDLHNWSIGYTWIGKAFQKTGLNRHCKYLMLSYSFDQLGLQRVEFRADLRNANSIRAMKAIGCKEEGVLRKNRPLPAGKWLDSILLSILKEEWDTELGGSLAASL
jgi:N-acetyltransferase